MPDDAALVQGRGHLPAARQGVLRLERRRHRRLPRPDRRSSTTSRTSASTRSGCCRSIPSPLHDDGYDVADYHDVHPPYGTRDDFTRFVREAHARGLRVITELVVNHTSDQHPWFQAARRAPHGLAQARLLRLERRPTRSTPARASSSPTPRRRTGPGTRWRKQYYWHRFFSHQPDLNFDNPHVLQAVLRTMRFWLDMGVDGFRLDAIPYLVEREGTNNENLPETHAVLKQIRAALDASYTDKLLLAEANQWPEDVRAVLRRRRRVPHGVPLPADAAHVHGDRAGGPPPDRRDHAADARHPRRTASGRSSCATTTSSRSRW